MLDRLKEILEYDPNTGDFTWINPTSSRVKVGDIAGSGDKDGYKIISIDGKRYPSHRLAWLYTYGEQPQGFIDHKDRDKTNNRIDNLRIATKAQNSMNRDSLGFSWHTKANKWSAQIKVDGKYLHLGLHQTILDARCAYLRARLELFGEFA